MAQYGKTQYWDERYMKDPEPFDWWPAFPQNPRPFFLSHDLSFYLLLKCQPNPLLILDLFLAQTRYQRFSGLKDLISQYIKKTDNILQAGAGNSRLSEVRTLEEGVG
jgi:hypothetical protein